jgi:hypothetical protein
MASHWVGSLQSLRPYEQLQLVVSALFSQTPTRTRAGRIDPLHPRHVRLGECANPKRCPLYEPSDLFVVVGRGRRLDSCSCLLSEERYPNPEA